MLCVVYVLVYFNMLSNKVSSPKLAEKFHVKGAMFILLLFLWLRLYHFVHSLFHHILNGNLVKFNSTEANHSHRKVDILMDDYVRDT